MMREELGLLIGAELTDPRLADAMVSVTDVKVSQDLRNARVYVEHHLGPARSGEVLGALRHAETYLRHALAENLDLRFVPMLSFHIDSSNERGRRIDALLDALGTDAAEPTSQPVEKDER
jgi:ribosome-binding factor A